MEGTFRALRHRNYQLFFVGQGISLIGTWMQTMAMQWLVYRLTNSDTLLGVVGFTTQIPAFFMSPVAGVLVDRWPKRKIIVATQSLAMAQAAVLAFLVITGWIQVWHIVALGVVLGLVNAFDMPARQAFMSEIVEDRSDLSNAIALNSSLFNSARLIGPVIAGLAIHYFGEGFCFLSNAGSYVAVIGALLAMRIAPFLPREDRRNVWYDLKEGAKYLKNHKAIRLLVVNIGFISLVSGTYMVLMPVLAKKVYQGDSRTLGVLLASVAVGAVAGALSLASRKSVHGLGRTMLLAAFVLGLAVLCLGFTQYIVLGCVLLAFVGYGQMLQMASTNTMIQSLVADEMRGRVMSFYMMAFIGTMPVGSLVGGALSEKFGPNRVLAVAGALILLAALAFTRVSKDLGPHLNGTSPES